MGLGSESQQRMALVLSLLCLSLTCLARAAEQRSTYIVHMAKSEMPAEFSDHGDWYGVSLQSVSESAEIIYSYDTVLHGFSARLTQAEAEALETQPGVMFVNPEIRYDLHTTRTPEFLHLDETNGNNVYPQANTASDVVVGVLDTGVWPESKSYDDTGFGPVPANWKGTCETGPDFNSSACNRKLIGARFFSKGYEANKGPIDQTKETRSPRDNDGHGTHTSSTAAGSAVAGASLLGFATGTARGMAVGARVAAYKVCWVGGCFSSDILAAMDAAVSDGCGILSMSLGGGTADYFRDSVAIGAFSAMEKGVLVSCSAGNSGPGASTLSNLAPWITTIGAGTIDRDFPAYVTLGNGQKYSGVSLYSGKPLANSTLPIVYAGKVSNATVGNLCMPGTLVPEKVQGKIVMCDRGTNPRVQKGLVVQDAGGAGMVLANTAANGEELVADAHLLPAAAVGQKSSDSIKSYLLSDPNPMATIVFGGTQIGITPSPVVAAFSSRGPNIITPQILKPDLIAPGVNILAGWTGSVGPTGLAADPRRVEFNIISGTSMSCPHVSGLAALLKEAHPDWSPAAIRSALMTTAYSTYASGDGILDVATGKAATPFDVGAGHVDPPRAIDPGLVYDITVDDYLDFLCALNYTQFMIATVAKRANYTCDAKKSYAVSYLNYPSFSVVFGNGTTMVKHTRTLTNVGGAGTYKVNTLTSGAGDVKVAVNPSELNFKKSGEQQSYTVTFTSSTMPSGSTEFGRLVWSDGKHVVASPIAITWS
ncbi:Subtilisin-like protease [Rhynchospora pubera]|uniref:Subtilisin-like protease n=1 Tax=Rhynchospora pubera TaxID=906938 RepID=A0AAV8H3T1_9POAL|nr:Subtilisin-like protease [Rhynchospora pubera]